MNWFNILKRFDDMKDITDEEGNVIGQVGSAPYSHEYQDNQTPVQKIIQRIKDSGLPIPDLSKVHEIKINGIWQRGPITGQKEEVPLSWTAFPGTKGPDMNIYDMAEKEKYNDLYNEVIMKPKIAAMKDDPLMSMNHFEQTHPELVGFTEENFQEAVAQLKRPSVTRHTPGHR